MATDEIFFLSILATIAMCHGWLFWADSKRTERAKKAKNDKNNA